MNRREVMTAGVVAAVASTLGAQIETNCPTGLICSEADQARRKQRLVCSERGHTPTVFGNSHGLEATTMIFRSIPDRAQGPYPQCGPSEWQTCWYCKTRYRFVTTLEEQP